MFFECKVLKHVIRSKGRRLKKMPGGNKTLLQYFFQSATSSTDCCRNLRGTFDPLTPTLKGQVPHPHPPNPQRLSCSLSSMGLKWVSLKAIRYGWRKEVLITLFFPSHEQHLGRSQVYKHSPARVHLWLYFPVPLCIQLYLCCCRSLLIYVHAATSRRVLLYQEHQPAIQKRRACITTKI